MKLERRHDRILLIPDRIEEAILIDAVLGDKVGEDGLISKVTGEVRLSDGYGQQYIVLQKVEQQ